MNLLVGFDQVVSGQSGGLVQNQRAVCEGIVKRLPNACSLQTERPHSQSACEEETAVGKGTCGSHHGRKREKALPV